MLDDISQKVFLNNDRLGWLVTQVLVDYYSKTNGININHWMKDLDGEKQMKFILLLMSEQTDFGKRDQFPLLKFLINQFRKENGEFGVAQEP